MLYKNLPRGVGLRRITLHKTLNLRQEVVYLLIVECSHFMDHIGEAANLLPILRARICGYTGIFRCIDSFWHKFSPPSSPTYNYYQKNYSSKETAKEEENVNKYDNCKISNEEMNGLAKGYGPKTIPTNHAQLNPGTSVTSGTTLGFGTTSGQRTTSGLGTNSGQGTISGQGTTSAQGTTSGITTIPEEVVEDQNPDPMPTQKYGFFASLFGSS